MFIGVTGKHRQETGFQADENVHAELRGRLDQDRGCHTQGDEVQVSNLAFPLVVHLQLYIIVPAWILPAAGQNVPGSNRSGRHRFKYLAERKGSTAHRPPF